MKSDNSRPDPFVFVLSRENLQKRVDNTQLEFGKKEVKGKSEREGEQNDQNVR